MSAPSVSDGNHLKVHQTGRHGDPLNAEPPIDELTQHGITPISNLFHRNHDDIVYEPNTKAAYSDWMVSLRVDEDIAKEHQWKEWEEQDTRMLPLQDIVEAKDSCQGLQHFDTTATIECAGNRREEFAEGQKAEGIQWGPGVIANVYWSGASIRSLLLLHSISDPYAHHSDLSKLTPSDSAIRSDCADWARSLHLHLLSAQPTSESDRPEGEYFGASIPLSTAMHPNQFCILAHRHNGKTLEQAHGFPIRAVVPGHAGARWVKWLRGLRISKSENDSPPMQLDYKILTPPENSDDQHKKEWRDKIMGSGKDVDYRKQQLAEEEPMQRLGMGSAIEAPRDGDVLKGSPVSISGYAVGQDGSPVIRVECTLMKQEDPSESSTSLRKRAEQQPDSDWCKTDVVSNKKEGQDKSEDKIPSWAWTLWKVQVPLPQAPEDEGARYAIIARATTASGIQQEMESPWNVRGFQTRSWPVIRGLRLDL